MSFVELGTWQLFIFATNDKIRINFEFIRELLKKKIRDNMASDNFLAQRHCRFVFMSRKLSPAPGSGFLCKICKIICTVYVTGIAIEMWRVPYCWILRFFSQTHGLANNNLQQCVMIGWMILSLTNRNAWLAQRIQLLFKSSAIN